MKKNTFSMIDENGNEVVYDVLFTFESDELILIILGMMPVIFKYMLQHMILKIQKEN